MARLQALPDKNMHIQRREAFMTNRDSTVRPLKAPFFDGVVVWVKTKQKVRCFHEKQKAGFFGNGFDHRERAYL